MDNENQGREVEGVDAENEVVDSENEGVENDVLPTNKKNISYVTPPL